MKRLDVVALTEDLPDRGLLRGQLIVLHYHPAKAS